MDLITITHQKDSTFKARIRNHTFFSDMSVEDGGDGKAPSPAEFFVSSLGLCIGMIINIYCLTHGYNSENTEISMTYLLRNNPKRIKNITIDISLPDNFPAQKKQAIGKAIKTCVIYNSLHNDTEIDIEID